MAEYLFDHIDVEAANVHIPDGRQAARLLAHTAMRRAGLRHPPLPQGALQLRLL